ncbi:Prephenate and/or arogenate dehydrogenase [Euzebya pacifica]|uniref:Prephenate dehydrogenase n=2 Tax=Euzebya pacifica TaxID=1608957 RepID=A0A346XWH9_9ACTN|nr:prephenate dehydrogenase [Euzebya pacifica]AXV06576.1 Prephenate and/or arogenate dehydrogenase [Euzebya pacifica]
MRVAIIGTGLIGASLGLAFRRAESVRTVVGHDADNANLATALTKGALDSATTNLTDAAENADVVVLAVPPSVIERVAEAVVPHMADGAVLTDVGSVKGEVVAAMERAVAGSNVHVVGGHPMAGSHEHGPETAMADMFVGATWLLTPTASTDQAALDRMTALVADVGAQPVVVDPKAHDLLVAVISHVPQLTATTLMTLAAERARKEDARLLLLAGGGFRDATRVAASNPEMWLQICQENSEAIVQVLDEYAARIGQLRMMLHDFDSERLSTMLTDAREARNAMPGKGGVSGQLVELRVVIPDAPGAIADITSTVSSLGINIEDIGIDHAPDGKRGQMRLAVNGFEAAEKAHEALGANGYEVLERAS